MSETEAWYFTRCEFCLKNNGFLLWAVNVNSSLTTDQVGSMGRNQLGRTHKEVCNHCEATTLQTVVAYKWVNPRPQRRNNRD